MKIPIIVKEDGRNNIIYIGEFAFCRAEAKISSFVEVRLFDFFTNNYFDTVHFSRLFREADFDISVEAFKEIIKELDKCLEANYKSL